MSKLDQLAARLRHLYRCTRCQRKLPRSEFGSYSRGDRMAVCQTCVDAALQRREEQREGTSREHLVTPSRHCPRCYGMPWRVDGERCVCGLEYAPEPPVEIPVRIGSPAAWALDHAPGDIGIVAGCESHTVRRHH